jgi:hypothetical protein
MPDSAGGERRRRTLWGASLGLAAFALVLGLALITAGNALVWAAALSFGLAAIVPLVLAVAGGIMFARSPRVPPPRWWWIPLTLAGVPVLTYAPIAFRTRSLHALAARVPAFPGARLVATHEQPVSDENRGTWALVMYETAAPAEAIARFYDDSLTALGWILNTPRPYLTQHTYWYVRPGGAPLMTVEICRQRTGWVCFAAGCEDWSGPKAVAITVADQGVGLELPRSERCRAAGDASVL